ncbi:MAG: RNase P subunit [Candidatus Methylarchaceae archaeon HK02M1]|nr:RNase P subunit [Candidatus Methylarchaceae archaeon HK02M1]
MRKRIKDLALQRVEILLDNALKNAREDMDLAQRQASIARRLCMKFNIRLPYEKRQLFCRGCKRFIVPGINARVRLKNKPRVIRITCLECGHLHRKGIDRKS